MISFEVKDFRGAKTLTIPLCSLWFVGIPGKLLFFSLRLGRAADAAIVLGVF